MKYIPNTITLANLFCGCLSIVMAFSGKLEQLILAGGLIFLAAIFDFLDGFAAKMLKAYSEIGKQLDSLADVVSFGVAPAMIAYRIILANQVGMELPAFLPYVAFIMVLFSALRLAKYNIDTEQTDHFIGLPTPANGMFWASLPLVISDLHRKELFNLDAFFFHPIVVAGLCVFFAILLVLPIPTISLKFKTVDFKSNWQRFVMIWFVLGLYFVIGISALPIGILIYPVFSYFCSKGK